MSKFKSIIAAAKNNPSEVEETETIEAEKLEAGTVQTSQETEAIPESKPETSLLEKPIENVAQPQAVMTVEVLEGKGQQTEPKKMGRPKGKRSNPDFEQVTAYIKSQTYTSVRIELLKEGQKREFSELIQELLDDWLQSRD